MGYTQGRHGELAAMASLSSLEADHLFIFATLAPYLFPALSFHVLAFALDCVRFLVAVLLALPGR